ncbi:Flavin-dependent oxidoreductase, luciferase family (includes alkanesulfonate monooxygenase SsuD and methylene tetrahydromethanopterin reductase) [Actinomadura madurae]|uniref:Flavin-dependent oxidoreductase, luciferase family (Includes alkanesulfonate monooxygenase SsuD and methylene tetrahydromethanopterin reductase) n=1 Tax=Actinomadura madurae TaxID=1993 RepID=A0A1I5XMJ7_9ACTN|nr:LLM class flavin-dependent oxidoreductase [Actinomadura madurae]SFQ33195.1 Flavin-dependent oxidoreductase, luciferase family (includes alkanesulfonate monooxygenase SsuD and methylene tetrahydromethanopterin reductase) [Actinomadura madurae]
MTAARPTRGPLRFGVSLAPDPSVPLIRVAQDADRFGLDLLGVRDEPYRRDTADALTLMATVLASTSRIRVLPAVACLPLRPPAVLAKALATMDRLSGGRVELGLGSGAAPDGIETYGGPRLGAAAARRAVEEAVQIIRLHWSDQNGLRFQGEHYRFAAAQAGPAPAHQIGIWLGVTGPRGLDLAGRVADGWIAPSSLIPPKRLADGQRRLADAALRAGRDPADLRRVYVLEGAVDARESRGFLHGPPRQWIYELTELAVGHGVDSFLFAGDPEHLPIFALEVVPAVREQVARERGAVLQS